MFGFVLKCRSLSFGEGEGEGGLLLASPKLFYGTHLAQNFLVSFAFIKIFITNILKGYG
jgi:hypothetical protein